LTLTADFGVIGGGIAGASAAWALAEHGRVVLLEAEDRPGVHATGRSAALFHLIYGGPGVQPLSRASMDFFRTPPDGFTDHPLLQARGVLIIARPGEEGLLAEKVAEAPDAYRILDAGEALRLWPALRPGYGSRAAFDASCADIDVDALHQGFLRGARGRGAIIRTNARVFGIARDGGGWRVSTAGGEISCGTIINAAGAWADTVGALAGASRLCLQPKRRTAALIDAPPGGEAWPMLIDVTETFYAKPAAGRMLLSPAEETDTEPHDAAADDLALAEGVERLEAATTLTVARKPVAWAGLRTFAPDRLPVVGEDPALPGFFWLAGQGGFGVQTSPAMAALLASAVTGSRLPDHWADFGLSMSRYSPHRLLTNRDHVHAG
jgi:D-arginine dehydrogenase